MILGAEPKNQVIWTIRCKVMQGLYIEKITCFASLCLYLYLYLYLHSLRRCGVLWSCTLLRHSVCKSSHRRSVVISFIPDICHMHISGDLLHIFFCLSHFVLCCVTLYFYLFIYLFCAISGDLFHIFCHFLFTLWSLLTSTSITIFWNLLLGAEIFSRGRIGIHLFNISFKTDFFGWDSFVASNPETLFQVLW